MTQCHVLIELLDLGLHFEMWFVLNPYIIRYKLKALFTFRILIYCKLSSKRITIWPGMNTETFPFNFSREQWRANFFEINEFRIVILYRKILYILYLVCENSGLKISMMGSSDQSDSSHYKGYYESISGIEIALQRPQILL